MHCQVPRQNQPIISASKLVEWVPNPKRKGILAEELQTVHRKQATSKFKGLLLVYAKS